MIVNCPSCRKKFNVDEGKLPEGKVSLKCPSCSSKITLDGRGAGKKASFSGVPAVNSPEWATLKKQVTREVFLHMGLDIPSDLKGSDGEVDDGSMALVCEDEKLFQEAVASTLRNLGYKVEIASDKAGSLKALQKKSYDIVTVDHRFPDDEEGGFEILKAINGLPPETRRRMFVAYISADLATMDTNSAFVLGANLTVSKKDIKALDRILRKGMQEHEKLYSVFTRVEEELQRQQQ